MHERVEAIHEKEKLLGEILAHMGPKEVKVSELFNFKNNQLIKI
jgi:hypothetical protein